MRPIAIARLRQFLAALVVVYASGAAPPALVAQGSPPIVAKSGTIPDRLTDAEFWKLMSDISEPGGVFGMADNFVSNEGDVGTIAAQVRDAGPHGGVYMGVGPEQNLTYVAAMRPKMVFIVDIRRQAVMHHLLYKAIFELAKDPADFISLLFAKPRPAGLDSTTSIDKIWSAFEGVATDTVAARVNRERFTALLTKTHGFTFTPDEQAAFDHVQHSFVDYGPLISTTGPRGGGLVRGATSIASSTYSTATINGTVYAVTMPPPGVFSDALTFVVLTRVVDSAGRFNSFLGSYDNYRVLKDLHMRNMFVPASGDFGGPKAIRAVGAYVKEHGATVSAFYVSNVEDYLFKDRIAPNAFYENVRTLPTDASSVFIRPGGARNGSALCPIGSFLASVKAGRVTDRGIAAKCAR